MRRGARDDIPGPGDDPRGPGTFPTARSPERQAAVAQERERQARPQRSVRVVARTAPGDGPRHGDATAPALDGWTPNSDTRPDRPGADTLADGHRRGRPYGRTGSFVIRAPRPTRTDGRLQTIRGTRPAMGSAAAAVRLGVRSPSSRPSRVSILDGGPGGCPSGCPAVGWGASIRPPVVFGRGRMSGRLRSARRRLAPPTRPWPAIRGNLDVVLQALKDTPPEGLPRRSRDIPALWRTTVSCSSTSCRSSPGPPARRCASRWRRARSPSPGP
jgi:hypothetical protein